MTRSTGAQVPALVTAAPAAVWAILRRGGAGPARPCGSPTAQPHRPTSEVRSGGAWAGGAGSCWRLPPACCGIEAAARPSFGRFRRQPQKPQSKRSTPRAVNHQRSRGAVGGTGCSPAVRHPTRRRLHTWRSAAQLHPSRILQQCHAQLRSGQRHIQRRDLCRCSHLQGQQHRAPIAFTCAADSRSCCGWAKAIRLGRSEGRADRHKSWLGERGEADASAHGRRHQAHGGSTVPGWLGARGYPHPSQDLVRGRSTARTAEKRGGLAEFTLLTSSYYWFSNSAAAELRRISTAEFGIVNVPRVFDRCEVLVTNKRTFPVPALKQPAAAPPDRLLTVQEVAAMLGVTVASIWRGVADGRLPQPVYPLSRSPRWIRDEVNVAVEKTRAMPATAMLARRDARRSARLSGQAA